MTLEAYPDAEGRPIPEAVICTRCQGGAYQRLAAYKLAKESGLYREQPRIDITDAGTHMSCIFCGGDGQDDDDE